jgi:hypothetical protein
MAKLLEGIEFDIEKKLTPIDSQPVQVIDNSSILNVDVKTATLPYPKEDIVFTIAKGKSYFVIDNTSLKPNVTTLIGGNFNTKYTKQLQEIVFNPTEKTFSSLIEVLYLYKEIIEEKYPIVIKSSSYPKLVPKIVFALNEFFKVNNYIIGSIYETVDSSFFGVSGG